MICTRPFFLVFLFIEEGLAEIALKASGRRPMRSTTVKKRTAGQEADRCAVEAHAFGSDAVMRRGFSIKNKELFTPWQASVGAVFREGRYEIDYATLGETTTLSRRPGLSSSWEPIAEVNTLWWVTEPAGLPFTRYLPETGGLGCEETIIEWGKALLKNELGSSDEASAILAVARKALRGSQIRENREASAEQRTHEFGSDKSPLYSTITFLQNPETNGSLVSSIKFVDFTVPSHSIEIPLLSKNLELLRYWTGTTKQPDADGTEITLQAADWGIDAEEVNISESEKKNRAAATMMAVAAGWHERLAPGRDIVRIEYRAYHGLRQP
ncbi:hypothetical protein FOZ63_028354 [Perkinsus olseni]|uniref:Uncharacterized protein n=1 Tax=Perkinsus olseni TaxID=32597 RepID=A0A7J6Q0F6_PEROL|nr:hypothetical protein FOZ62_026579 [Perkinsus olseni]KAF4759513.1 hypothetical protein FOZ63_028354 [Perkinsus olseni]